MELNNYLFQIKSFLIGNKNLQKRYGAKNVKVKQLNSLSQSQLKILPEFGVTDSQEQGVSSSTICWSGLSTLLSARVDSALLAVV